MLSYKNIQKLVIALAAFLFSYILLGYYSYGDQIFYKRLYEAFKTAHLSEVMGLGLLHVSGAEPITLHLLWVGAAVEIEKNIFISIFNAILIYCLVVLLEKNKAPFYIYILLLTNFYVIVLLTGAERLKFAYIFFILAAISTSKLYRFSFLALSPLSHFQALIYFPSLILHHISADLRRLLSLFITVKLIRIVFLFIFLLVIISLFKFGEIVAKAQVYIAENANFIELTNLTILFLIAMSATRYKARMVLVHLPLFPAVFLLGGERVNMIAVSLVIYFLLIEQRLSKPLPLLLLLYFSMQSIFFVYNIIQYGDGFYKLK